VNHIKRKVNNNENNQKKLGGGNESHGEYLVVTNGQKEACSPLNVREMIVQGTKPVKKSSKPHGKIKAGEELKKTWKHTFVI
jgi:hypothetical protein